MTFRIRHIAALGTSVAIATLAPAGAPAGAAQASSPLPSSAYSTRAVCGPPTPGTATCMAAELVPQTAQARAHTHPLGVTRARAGEAPSPRAGDFGLRPADLHSAYDLPTSPSSPQTIALVDAYNDLDAKSDLEAYEGEFGLHCTGCFEKVNQQGQSSSYPFPAKEAELVSEQTFCEGKESKETPTRKEERKTACRLVEEVDGWTVEISLDIETARAVCQTCHIVLVEADSDSFENFFEAEETALGAAVGADEVSNSWGAPECITGAGCIEEGESIFSALPAGKVVTASAGDDGYLNWLEGEPSRRYANFPASSPNVVAVGGTRLELEPDGKWAGESVWNDGGESGGRPDGRGATGGGCSVSFRAPAWQQSLPDWAAVGCEGRRAVSDVSADADPYTGVAVYDTNRACETEVEEENGRGEVVFKTVHWCTIGGTSLASPLIASVFALAGGAHGVSHPADTLYANAAKTPGLLHDVTIGSNGECLSPFEFEAEEGMQSRLCSADSEAETSCKPHLSICLATAGYDGPTGLGSPDGIGAFEPSKGETSGGSSEQTNSTATGQASGGGPTAPAPPPPSPAPAPAATSAGAPSPQVTALALTLNALLAMNTSHPKLAKLAFTFRLNLAAHVLVALQRQAGRHRHLHWQTLRSLTIEGMAGHDSRQLGGHGTLAPGSYRLTLTPAGGRADSLTFKIG